MERTQVNIRVERDLLTQLDEMARAAHLDRTEMARLILAEGLARRQVDSAVVEYRQGRVSASRAAELAGISIYEMLDRIHDEGIPYEVDPETIERVGALLHDRAAAAESPAPDGTASVGDDGSGISELRQHFRPALVKGLFVGESSPAGGTHFYRANSNLFRMTRQAFAAALGEDRVPDGVRFLHFFRDEGWWLVDLADRPVNRLPGRPRRDAVDEGIDRLARLISETRPARIVVVKASIAAAVRRAAGAAGFAGEILELPFPVRQWQTVFVRRLASMLDSSVTPPTG